jgi:hypothetical protein
VKISGCPVQKECTLHLRKAVSHLSRRPRRDAALATRIAAIALDFHERQLDIPPARLERRVQNEAARFGDTKTFNRPVKAISFHRVSLIASSRPRETNSSTRGRSTSEKDQCAGYAVKNAAIYRCQLEFCHHRHPDLS